MGQAGERDPDRLRPGGPEKQRQQYINYYGSQEAYLKQIQGMGVSETMFDSINQGYYLYAGVRQAFCTEGSALYPAQEDIDALAKDSGYATCLLLYWPLDGEDDDNTRLAAESFAQQLRDSQDVAATYLDLAAQLGMENVTEEGVTASAGDMGETLAAAVAAWSRARSAASSRPITPCMWRWAGS